MTRFAPDFTACCSTASVAIDVVTTPVTTVEGSPALIASTVSAFHSTPMFFLMRSISSCAVIGGRGRAVDRERGGGDGGGERREFAPGQISHGCRYSLASAGPVQARCSRDEQQSRAHDREANPPRRRLTVRCKALDGDGYGHGRHRADVHHPTRPGEAPSSCHSTGSNQGPGGGRVARPFRRQP